MSRLIAIFVALSLAASASRAVSADSTQTPVSVEKPTKECSKSLRRIAAVTGTVLALAGSAAVALIVLNKRAEAGYAPLPTSQLTSFQKDEFLNKFPDTHFAPSPYFERISDKDPLMRRVEQLREWILAKSRQVPLANAEGQMRLKSGTLSLLWAQEFIGADLAFRKMAELPNTKVVPIATIDNGMWFGNIPSNRVNFERASSVTGSGGSHATPVANIILGDEVGVSPVARLDLAFGDFEFKYVNVPRSLRRIAGPTNADIRAINMSLTVEGDDRDVTQSLEALRSRGTVPVIAAGNVQSILFSKNDEEINGQLKTSSIIVGSLSEYGLPFKADGSENGTGAGPQVTISAPSSNIMQSKTGVNIGGVFFNRKFITALTSFGHTSGATPLVTGSIVNVQSILPDITYAEAEELLKKTAVQTLNAHENPRMHGVGMVNSIKMVELALRLKDQGWPNNRKKIFSDEASTGIYDFTEDSLAAFRIGTTLLKGETDTRKIELALSELRRSFLLMQNEAARDLLIKKYDEIGLTTNADFYRFLDPDFPRAVNLALNFDVSQVRQDIKAIVPLIGGQFGIEREKAR